MNVDLTVVNMNRRTYSANCQAGQWNGGHHMSLFIVSTPIEFGPFPCQAAI